MQKSKARSTLFCIYVPLSSRGKGKEKPFLVRAPGEGERGELGNRVSNLIVRLPLAERDPVARLRRIHETMKELKSSNQLLAMSILERVGEVTHPSLLTYFARASVEKRSSNFVFTNVPGPQQPWYLLEAPLLETYPVVPLMPMQGVGVAVMSYCGRLYWGFNSDWDALPDVHDLVEGVGEQFGELHAVAVPSVTRPLTDPTDGGALYSSSS